MKHMPLEMRSSWLAFLACLVLLPSAAVTAAEAAPGAQLQLYGKLELDTRASFVTRVFLLPEGERYRVEVRALGRSFGGEGEFKPIGQPVVPTLVVRLAAPDTDEARQGIDDCLRDQEEAPMHTPSATCYDFDPNQLTLSFGPRSIRGAFTQGADVLAVLHTKRSALDYAPLILQKQAELAIASGDRTQLRRLLRDAYDSLSERVDPSAIEHVNTLQRAQWGLSEKVLATFNLNAIQPLTASLLRERAYRDAAVAKLEPARAKLLRAETNRADQEFHVVRGVFREQVSASLASGDPSRAQGTVRALQKQLEALAQASRHYARSQLPAPADVAADREQLTELLRQAIHQRSAFERAALEGESDSAHAWRLRLERRQRSIERALDRGKRPAAPEALELDLEATQALLDATSG